MLQLFRYAVAIHCLFPNCNSDGGKKRNNAERNMKLLDTELCTFVTEARLTPKKSKRRFSPLLAQLLARRGANRPRAPPVYTPYAAVLCGNLLRPA